MKWLREDKVLEDLMIGESSGSVTGADLIQDSLLRNKRAFDFVSANSDNIEYGNIGNVKTIALKCNLDSTTEKILEGSASGDFILANAGTLSYASFDKAYVEGVETDTVATGWATLVFTSSTDVDCSAFTLALNDATYGDLKVEQIGAWSREFDADEVLQLTQDFNGLIPGNNQGLFDQAGFNIGMRGDALDDYGNTTTVVGVAITPDRFDIDDNAYLFRGDAFTDHILTDNCPAIDLGTEWTLVCHVNWNDIDGNTGELTGILSSYNGSDGYQIYYNKFQGKFQLWSGAGTTTDIGDFVGADGVDYTIIITRNASSLVTCYVNGVACANPATFATSMSNDGNDGSLFTTSSHTFGHSLDGISDFAFLLNGKSYTAAEVKAVSDILKRKDLHEYIRQGLPLPTANSLQGYWPLDDIGATVYDHGSGGVDGTVTGADVIKISNGMRARSFVSGNSDKIAFGDVGTIKTFGLWINFDTTTEVIAEARTGAGFLLASGGTLSYADFDKAFVDTEETDTITAGLHFVVFTSTTGITASALTLGLNNATYGDFTASQLFIDTDEMSIAEIKAIFRSTYRR